MYHIYYSEKINDKNKGKLLTIYAVYICCGFCTCIVEKKKLIKQKKTLKKKNTSQRERERSGPEAHQSVWSRLEFTERERERERETLL
jgi:hypothetical protein